MKATASEPKCPFDTQGSAPPTSELPVGAVVRRLLAQEFAVELHERTVGELLRRLSFRRLSVRPQLPQGKAEPGGFQHSFAVD
jgi:hypothetical protein